MTEQKGPSFATSRVFTEVPPIPTADIYADPHIRVSAPDTPATRWRRADHQERFHKANIRGKEQIGDKLIGMEFSARRKLAEYPGTGQLLLNKVYTIAYIATVIAFAGTIARLGPETLTHFLNYAAAHYPDATSDLTTNGPRILEALKQTPFDLARAWDKLVTLGSGALAISLHPRRIKSKERSKRFGPAIAWMVGRVGRVLPHDKELTDAVDHLDTPTRRGKLSRVHVTTD